MKEASLAPTVYFEPNIIFALAHHYRSIPSQLRTLVLAARIVNLDKDGFRSKNNRGTILHSKEGAERL